MGKKPIPVSLLKARRALNEGKPEHMVAGVRAEAAFKSFLAGSVIPGEV